MRLDGQDGNAPSVEGRCAEFLAAAEKGKANAQKIGGLAHQETSDADVALFAEAARARRRVGAPLHLAKYFQF